jgi:hypothetical protein
MTATRGSTSAGREPWEILHENWRDDDDAGRILKAASSPLTTSGFAAIQLLNGVAPLTAVGAAGGGAGAVADDLALLASTISRHGISTDSLIYVTTAAIATKIRTLAGPFFADMVMSSAAIPDNEIIAVIPEALATGFAGEVSIETSVAATLHFESATPLPIATVGSPNVVSAPTHSGWQEYLILVKLRGKMCWACQPSGVAWMQGIQW